MQFEKHKTKALPRAPRRWLWLALVALLANTVLCSAQTTNQATGLDYSSFRIITDRNIFNPRRLARNTPRPTQPAAHVDAFTLVGTMAYEKGPFAFFEGSSAEYRRVAKVADNIAGYKITNIQYNSVKLAGPTNELQLAVGMQMRREEDGPWRVAAAAEPIAAAPAREVAAAGSGRTVVGAATATLQDGPPAETDSAPATAAAASGDEDPVLKRLMQRREQEMNR